MNKVVLCIQAYSKHFFFVIMDGPLFIQHLIENRRAAYARRRSEEKTKEQREHTSTSRTMQIDQSKQTQTQSSSDQDNERLRAELRSMHLADADLWSAAGT
jgi:hypothetical protein